MTDTLRCEICKQNIYAEEGKDPQAVLRGHQIRCKMLKRQEEEASAQEVMQKSMEPEPERKEEDSRQEQPKRKERIPFGTPRIGLSRFNASMEEGYAYRIFNSNWRHDPDRIKRAKDAGYEIVNQEDVTVGTNEDGSAIKGILMRIPEKFYEEDQKAKQKVLDDIDAEIYRGRYQEQPGEKRYIPSSGIHVDVKSEP